MFGAVGGYKASVIPIPKLDVAGSSPVARSPEIVESLRVTVVGRRVGPDDFF
jgi:hypothetical protein